MYRLNHTFLPELLVGELLMLSVTTCTCFSEPPSYLGVSVWIYVCRVDFSQKWLAVSSYLNFKW